MYAYPGLLSRDGAHSVRLFRSQAEAGAATRAAWPGFCAKSFDRELAWWQRDLAHSKSLADARSYYVTMGTLEEFQSDAYASLLGYLFECDRMLPLRQSTYEATIQQAKARIMGLWSDALDLFDQILSLHHVLKLESQPYPGMPGDLAGLFPARWLRQVPFTRLKHYPRYLKAMQIRTQRFHANSIKDREKAARVTPWTRRLMDAYKQLTPGDPRWVHWTQLRWMVEEYRVSLFAQELGTAEPVSEKRMLQCMERMELKK